MKKIFSLLALCVSFSAFAQIKVYPKNKVLIGPVWWDTYPSDSSVLYINGRTEFAPYPAQSSIRIMNNINGPGNIWNDPGIIPLFPNAAWLGTLANPFWKVYSKEFYGTLYTLSDERLKKNINKVDRKSALQKIMTLQSYTYDYNLDLYKGSHTKPDKMEKLEKSGKNQVGFMAQDIQKILPEAVGQDDSTGYYSVNYVMFIPLLVEAMKAQQEKIDDLEKQLQQLKK